MSRYPCNQDVCPLIEIELISLGLGKYAIVDKDDYRELSKFNWFPIKSNDRGDYRASRNKKRFNGTKGTVYMHRQILSLAKGDGKIVDHINRNPLDNRKKNLRLCTPLGSTMNTRPQKNSTSRYKGVFWDSGLKKWRAQIGKKNSKIYLGCYANEKEAANTYNMAAKKLYPEYAYLNEVI